MYTQSQDCSSLLGRGLFVTGPRKQWAGAHAHVQATQPVQVELCTHVYAHQRTASGRVGLLSHKDWGPLIYTTVWLFGYLWRYA